MVRHVTVLGSLWEINESVILFCVIITIVYGNFSRACIGYVVSCMWTALHDEEVNFWNVFNEIIEYIAFHVKS